MGRMERKNVWILLAEMFYKCTFELRSSDGLDLVAQGDVDRDELLELQAVDLLEAEQAVQALAALRRAVERQRCDLPLRSEMFLTPYFSAVAFVTATSLDEVNGVGGSAVDACLGQACLDLVVGLLRVLRDSLAGDVEERGQRGPGVLRVAADLPALERLERVFSSPRLSSS